ncbi:hypothetical protein WDU94_004563, partial [Cyamophila willieti]
VVPKLGSAAPQGAVKDFQGPRRPGQKKKNILRHNLLKSPHWCFKLKTLFSNNFRDILHSNLSDKGPAALSEGQ